MKTNVTKTSTLHMRIEPDLKKEAKEIVEDLGLSLSQAVSIYFRQIIRYDGLPFGVNRTELLRRKTQPIVEDIEIQEDNDDEWWKGIPGLENYTPSKCSYKIKKWSGLTWCPASLQTNNALNTI